MWYESLPEYLSAVTGPSLSGGEYHATGFWPVICACGCDRFGLVRAGSDTQRTCKQCGDIRYISRSGDSLGWEEAVANGGGDPFVCGYECDGTEGATVCLGFANYPNNPELDAVLWFYVGIRCRGCGIMEIFNDGKVGRGPTGEALYRRIAGDRPDPQPT